MTDFSAEDEKWMERALELARRGHGQTSPNPVVGAVLVRKGKLIGEGWHHQAGQPHAEIEAIRDARSKRKRVKGTTLYVTLEPCSTEGRTPACSDAIIKEGVEKVIAAAVDPNPRHAGKGLDLLRQAGLEVLSGLKRDEALKLNESFNHWIVHRVPFVTVKSAMTLDGKIATVIGESKWITSEKARAHSMELRRKADAILVGVNTVLADNPSLTARVAKTDADDEESPSKQGLRRIVLDTHARTPLHAKVVTDEHASLTSIVVGNQAPGNRISALQKHVNIIRAPLYEGRIDLKWLLRKLGSEDVTDLLVEGGGEVNASFLLQGMAHRVAFFYAPKIVGGYKAPKAVAGVGLNSLDNAVRLEALEWQLLEPDLLLTAKIRNVPFRERGRSRRRSSRKPRSNPPTAPAEVAADASPKD